MKTSVTAFPRPIFRMFAVLAITVFASTLVLDAASAEKWTLVAGETARDDEAVKLALEDFETTAETYGLAVDVADDTATVSGNVILVGDPSRNRMTKSFAGAGKIDIQSVDDEEGYQIATYDLDGRKVVVVAGGGLIGDVYGLYWLWDRIRVYRELPAVDTVRIPRLKKRLSLSWGRRGSGGTNKAEMRHALRQSINWISGTPILDLVPWDSEPERSKNEKNREKTKELIEYAHSLHMQYYSFANEFTYHPSLLEEFDASLSPCDPAFWDALQAKFRKLLTAMPELDGIELCNDDISGFWDDYRAFDLMHEGEGCEWALDKRYRTFIKKVREVVADEFDKAFFQFTWSLVSYEQHNQADVYRSIFTDEIPTDNLFLIPKITAADRWWHQPYNPTFNLTPHATMVGFETMNYYEGGGSKIFPTFSGQYFQAGLQTVLRDPNTNVEGAGYLVNPSTEHWNTRSAYSYVLNRLSWDPDEDIRTIAEDFCAIHFGLAAAEQMAEIYMLTPVAYKYGLHIEPVSYGKFNSFIHMRVGTFPAEGYPSIDSGKEHMGFLQEIFLRCKPWKVETLDDLDHGLATAKSMVEKYAAVKASIADPALAQKLENALNMTQLLIETNNLYVRTTFAYFGYRENPTAANKTALADVHRRMLDVRERFTNAPGFSYRLFGVDQLLLNVEQALEDVEAAERKLAAVPIRDELERIITQQQELYAKTLDERADEAVKFLHFEAMIDGRDIVVIKGDQYRIEHLRWDGPHIRDSTFFGPLPEGEYTVVPRDLQSRPMHPFVLEQPSKENDYTAKVYLYDKTHGQGLVEFDLYYIKKSPRELGLEIPWNE